ncbi:hypothetical protein PIB30_044151 [Stylosanthes scabra]|uniref:Uncharacterized protein n=1 Tax=Stylosanthes scabra TaxID=79078 RepID=A0ABU6VEH9_9FABA|nr:hypothetical protein [Stylosanthes scabra]
MLRCLVVEEKVRADLGEVSVSELQNQCEELAEDAKAAVSATKSALKAQLAILVPESDSLLIGFFKDIVDRKVVDPSGSDQFPKFRFFDFTFEPNVFVGWKGKGGKASFVKPSLVKTFRPPGIGYLGVEKEYPDFIEFK